MSLIASVQAHQILGSRGNPTVEVGAVRAPSGRRLRSGLAAAALHITETYSVLAVRAFLLCVGLTLAACDSGGASGGRRSFSFVGLPGTLTVDVPDRVTFSLNTYTRAALPRGYTATPRLTGESGAVDRLTVTALVDGFAVTALREGVSTLSLGLSAPGFRDTTLTFTVVSRGPCPPGAAPGQSDRFSITDGATARYDYAASSFERTSFPLSTSSRGVLTTTLSDVSCRGRVRSARLAYQYTGTSTSQVSGSPAPPTTAAVQRSGAYVVREDAANRVTYYLPPLSTPFRDSTAIVVPRYGTTETQTVTTQVDVFGRPCDETATFGRARGLVATNVSCSVGSGFSASRGLTRQP